MATWQQPLRAVPEETFGAMLRAKRFHDNLTQAELGQRLNVRQQTIGGWERGDRPQYRFLADLAAYVGLPDEQALRDLLDGEVRQTSQAAGAAHDPAELAVVALAKLAEAYAERVSSGTELTRDDQSILREIVAGLNRAT